MTEELIGYSHPYLAKPPIVPRHGRHLQQADDFQVIFRFRNGYGASVIRSSQSYGGAQGLFEIGFIRFTSAADTEWEFAHDRSPNGDVMGHLTQNEVLVFLDHIATYAADAQALAGANFDGLEAD